MMHRHCPAGFLCQRTRKGTVWKGEQHTMPTLNQDVYKRQTKDWARLTDADLAAIAACGCRQASCEKLHFDEHEAFSSLCFLEQHLTLQQLKAAADHLFADAACGHVLRVKGFAPDPQGTTGWLELNATAAGRTLEPIPQGQDVLIVIGEGLDKAAIEARLKA